MKLQATFEHKNGHGLHAIVQNPKYNDCNDKLVIYQHKDSKVDIELGDVCEVTIAYVQNRVIKRSIVGRYRTHHTFYQIAYAWIGEIKLSAKDIKKRTKLFNQVYNDFFPKHVMLGQHELLWKYITGEIDNLDLEIELREELARIDRDW